MKDSEVLKLRRPPPFYPQLASRSLLSVALFYCLLSLDAAVGVMRLHGLFFGTLGNIINSIFYAVLSRMTAISAEPVPIHHRQLSIDLPPVTKRIRPLLRNIVSRQIKRLQQSLTDRKHTLRSFIIRIRTDLRQSWFAIQSQAFHDFRSPE